MEKINIIIMLEMMGRPLQHVKETFSKLIDRMGNEKGIRIVNKKINEPKKLEDAELFTTFAEIELELESLQQLLTVIFGYMPSHIEIISPEELRVKNYDLNVLSNEITRRLHDYDAIAKKMIFEKSILENQLKQQGTKPAISEETEKKAKKVRKTRKSKKKKK